jgi:hypothetical protein
MARKLPWMAQEGRDNREKSSLTTKPRPEKRKPPENDPTSDSSDAFDGVQVPTSRPKQRSGISSARNPSSSPPPAPPPEEYMISGLEHDDGWVMVEDEFLSTARLYTAHLHHADYQRLKKLSRVRGASALSALVRPTDGVTKQSVATQKMARAKETRREIMKGVRNVVGSGDEDEEDAYLDDLRLAGLMSQGSGSVKLGKVIRSEDRSDKSKERRKEKPRDAEIDLDETDEGDLDIQPQAVPRKTANIEHKATSWFERFPEKRLGESFKSSLTTSISKKYGVERDSNRSTSLLESKEPSTRGINVNDFGSLRNRSALPPKLMQRMNKQKEAEAKQEGTKEETKKKSVTRLSDIPTFLL